MSDKNTMEPFLYVRLLLSYDFDVTHTSFFVSLDAKVDIRIITYRLFRKIVVSAHAFSGKFFPNGNFSIGRLDFCLSRFLKVVKRIPESS